VRHPHPAAERIRHGAATALLCLGAALVGQLWYQPLSASGLLLAANGLAYLLLSLGLFGTSRLSLLLAAACVGVYWMLRRRTPG
jgi:hypothetical protein